MKVRNGQTPIPLPPLVKNGDSISAAWANGLRLSIQRLRDRVPVATGYSNRKYTPPFQPYVRQSQVSESQFEIAIGEGFVIERVTGSSLAQKEIPPNPTDSASVEPKYERTILFHEVSGITNDETGEMVWHQITADQCAYIQFSTTTKGVIDGVPTVTIADDGVSQTHFTPEIGSYAGSAGNHLYKIAKLTIDENNLPQIETFQTGNHIEHYAERVTMMNLESGSGSVKNVLKSYDPTVDEIYFRTISQLGGSGEPIIKDGDTDSIEYRRIKERDTQPQVTVHDDGDAIRIEGNGVDGDNAAVTVEDGLVTEVKDFAGGIWGTFQWDFADSNNPSNSCNLLMTFENGLLTAANATATNQAGSGTQADPYVIDFYVLND